MVGPESHFLSGFEPVVLIMKRRFHMISSIASLAGGLGFCVGLERREDSVSDRSWFNPRNSAACSTEWKSLESAVGLAANYQACNRISAT